MTKLTFYVDSKHYIGFSCSGHSGYAGQGSDIVCAAVSTAVQMSVKYFLTYHNNDVDVNVDSQSAVIELRCKTWFTESDKQLSVLYEFSKELAEQYPEYFTFEILEV